MSGANDEAHPAEDVLTAFDAGLLAPEEWAVVEKHLAGCDTCCRRIDALPTDAFTVLVRSAAGAPPPQDADTCAESPSPPGRPDGQGGSDWPEELAGHDRYRLLAPLGVGGMGRVFKAEHRLMGRTVALKVIRKELTGRPAAVERFRQEVRSAARLSHPNIVTAHDADRAGDLHFLVMEYVEGEGLDKVVARRGPLPVAEACDYARQAALALHYASGQGMVHRDVKPANLLLTAGGRVKVVDFGLARFRDESSPDPSITPTGVLVGTPDFIAPEQAQAASTADVRSDVYSLGCTLYFLLAGRPPFPEGTALQKLLAHQQQQPRPLSSFRADVPAGLAEVVGRMLAKDPARRYQTHADVAAALHPYAGDREGAAPVARRAPATGRRVAAAALAGVVLALVVLGAVLAFRGEEETPVTPPPPSVQKSPAELRRIVTGGPLTAAWVVSGGGKAVTADERHNVRVWDLETGKELGKFAGHTEKVLCVSLSNDHKRVLSGGMDKQVLAWDLENGKPLAAMKEHHAVVRGLAFHWDNRHAVTAGDDGKLIMWDTTSGQIGDEIHTGRGRVRQVSLNKGGLFAAVAAAEPVLRVWNMKEKREARSFEGHADAVNCVLWSRFTRYLLSGGADGTLRLWRFDAEREVRRFSGHKGEVLCAALSSDDRWAVSGGADGTVRLWDVEAGAEAARFDGHEGDVLHVGIAGDGKFAASAGRDGTLRVWKLPEKCAPGPYPGGPVERDTLMAVSADGGLTAFATADRKVRLWDTASGEGRGTLKANGDVLALAFAPDRRLLALGGEAKVIRLWDADAGEEKGSLKGHAGEVRSLAFTQDGRTLASGGGDRLIKLWDVAAGTERATLKGHGGAVRALAFTADGGTLVSGGADGTVRLWDVARGKETAAWQAHAGGVWAVAVAPDGSVITGGEDGSVKRLDARSGKETQSYKGHAGPVWAVAVSPDGKTLVTGGADMVVRPWELDSGRSLPVIDGHLDRVTSLAFLPGGRLVVSGSIDGSVQSSAVPPPGKGGE